MPSAPQLESTPTSHQRATPRSVIRQRIYKIIFSTAIIASATAFIAPLVNAQDLGEIARQERAKKQNNPAPPATHVYTNEDMQRQQILTPEDQSRFSATTQPATIKPAPSAAQSASESTPPGNADLPIGARPPILPISTTPTASPAPTQNPVRQSAAQKTKEFPAQKNISPTSTTRAKTNATPTTRANISTASATSAKSVPAPASQPAPTLIPVAAAHPVAQVFAQTIINDAPIPATVPPDQMPLGDVARYYRAKKRQLALANPQIDPGQVNAPSAATLTATIPSEIPLNQMPLGDVARYYRAKKREEDAAIANRAPTISATSVSPPTTPSSTNTPPNTSISAYPLALAAMPLAAMKPPPATRISKSRPRPITPTAHRPITRRPIAHPTPPHPPVAPKRSVGGQATSIRLQSGETLWQLARKYLGTGTRWHELAALNTNIHDPRRLQIGAQLVLRPPADS